jgi:hypothetical protein
VDTELAELVGRDAIRHCLARLARRDPGLIRGCYWPEATVDFGIFAGGFDDYLAWVVPGSPAVVLTQHILGQSLIELAGDRAGAETHVAAYHRIDTGAGHRDTCLYGRYLDRFERRDGAWRIAERSMLYDWQQDLGASVDWSGGLMGVPFSADHFTGRVTGDHSEALFGAARARR